MRMAAWGTDEVQGWVRGGAGVRGIDQHMGATLPSAYSASGAVISGKAPALGLARPETGPGSAQDLLCDLEQLTSQPWAPVTSLPDKRADVSPERWVQARASQVGRWGTHPQRAE